MNRLIDFTLADTAFDVVRRYKEFDSYGSEAAALRALCRRCPAFSPQQCREAYTEALQLYEAVCCLVEQHKEVFWEEFNTNQSVDFRSVLPDLALAASGIPVEVGISALSWVWYWHHLR